MGYVHNPPSRLLDLVDPALADLEVWVRPVPVGVMLRVTELESLLSTVTNAESVQAIDELAGHLGGALDRWNLELPDIGEVKPTKEGLLSLDMPLLLTLVAAWMVSVLAVPRPLDRPSPDGGPSPEASMPMEVSSPSPEP